MILQVDIEKTEPNMAVVNFTGALTLGTSLLTADSKLQQTIREGFSRLVLNMAGVPYLDSAGLGVLVQTSGLAREHGGELRMCGVSERVASLVKMTRTDELLPMDLDVDASRAALA
ncbi:MAG TPA: STAS domain-containing protein [Acidobacteriaceae bacterium]|jgi:anti-sigma B factor antagonist|nr:STAS domain-containing protein [Acidobacteriaceae bacterium]